MKGLRDTEVLITGGTLEIGQGIAVSTAVEGWRVAINHLRHKDDAAEIGILSHLCRSTASTRPRYAEFSLQSPCSTKGEKPMPAVIVFDVNETLLNLAALDPHFERAFGDTSARQQWFAQVLQYALVVTVIDSYVDFGTIGAAALDITADRRGVSLSAADRAAILDGMLTLPPHPEVPESLARLRAAGTRLATLTNSTARVAEAQLTNAGLIACFDQVLSIDAVRKFKPAAGAYRMAARELRVTVSDLRLVAAHDWDVAGALRAGWAAAFVARLGMAFGPLGERPDIVGRDLRDVVDQILGE